MSGRKDITIYDIAQQLKISTATVSRALQDNNTISKKTRKRVRQAAEKLGYRSNVFARNLRMKRTNVLGVVVPRLNSHFMSSAIAGMEQVASQHSYKLLIGQSSENAEKEAGSLDAMLESGVDGLLISVSNETKSVDAFKPFIDRNIPVVFFDRILPDIKGAIFVAIDNEKAGQDAANHLLDQGREHLAIVLPKTEQTIYLNRLAGFRKAVEKRGLSFTNENVFHTKLGHNEGRLVGEHIFAMHNRPDGLFFTNDDTAVGCVLALQQHGVQIPQEIAIVGFNNDPVCTIIMPNLSTIDYPGRPIGELVALHLIQQLNGNGMIQETSGLILKHHLIVRESSQLKIEEAMNE